MHVIGHGVDLVEISRIERMIATHGDHFLDRCFTAAERRYADSSSGKRAERYAARFACKEAVLKALGTGWNQGVAWTDIEVLVLPSGSPNLRISGRSAEIAAELGITAWHISLSHTSGLAQASAIGSGLPPVCR